MRPHLYLERYVRAEVNGVHAKHNTRKARAMQVRLKPGCAKAQESTYTCTQVFVAISCQPKALQVDISGQSYLLSPGDHFFVPDQTLYSMKNHSKDTDAEVAFVVIKPSGR